MRYFKMRYFKIKKLITEGDLREPVDQFWNEQEEWEIGGSGGATFTEMERDFLKLPEDGEWVEVASIENMEPWLGEEVVPSNAEIRDLDSKAPWLDTSPDSGESRFDLIRGYAERGPLSEFCLEGLIEQEKAKEASQLCRFGLRSQVQYLQGRLGGPRLLWELALSRSCAIARKSKDGEADGKEDYDPKDETADDVSRPFVTNAELVSALLG